MLVKMLAAMTRLTTQPGVSARRIAARVRPFSILPTAMSRLLPYLSAILPNSTWKRFEASILVALRVPS